MRIVFMGTPGFAVPTLSELAGRGYDIAAAYSQPPKPSGRGLTDRKSPVHQAAEGFGIEVRTPRTLRDAQVQEEFAALEPDVVVVVAYGLLLPAPILGVPADGCLNLHASLLPRWRGAAPIQRAVMAGDRETGVMVMRMEEGLDTGPIGLVERVSIGPDETAGELQERLAILGADLMARALAALQRDVLSFTPQPEEEAVYARKIDKAEARIDWSRPAGVVHNHVRGLSPLPGTWFEATLSGEPVRVKALRSTRAEGAGRPGEVLDEQLTVACGDGALKLLQVQRAGKAPVAGEEFVRGARLRIGERLM